MENTNSKHSVSNGINQLNSDLIEEENFLYQLNLSKCNKTVKDVLSKQPHTRSKSKCKKVLSNTKNTACKELKKVKTRKKNTFHMKVSIKNSVKMDLKETSEWKKKVQLNSFSKLGELVEDKRTVTNDDPTSVSSGFCRLCRRAYSSRNERLAHFSSSNHILLSEARRGTDSNLLQQEAALYRDLNFPAKCLTCGEGPLPRREFLAHHRRHSGSSPYHCIRCQLRYHRRCDLLRHIQNHLGSISRLKCPECAATFPHHSSIVEHLISKHSLSSSRRRNYKCTECSRAFFSKQDVHKHMKTHTGHSIFRCEVCDRSFSSKHVLESHRNKHTGEAPFKCNLCSYSARSKQLLSRHLRNHRGEKPFKCQLCSYASASTSGLKRHMNKHSGTKPYKCPYCTYRSSNIENLRKHIKSTRKHKGLNVYPCHRCSFSCDLSAAYLRHLKQFHFPYLDEENSSATKLSGILVCDEEEKPADGASGADDSLSTLLVTSVDNPPMIEMVIDEDPPVNASHQVVTGLDDELLGALMKIPNLQQVILAPGDGDAPVTLVIGAEHDVSDDDVESITNHDVLLPLEDIAMKDSACTIHRISHSQSQAATSLSDDFLPHKKTKPCQD